MSVCWFWGHFSGWTIAELGQQRGWRSKPPSPDALLKSQTVGLSPTGGRGPNRNSQSRILFWNALIIYFFNLESSCIGEGLWDLIVENTVTHHSRPNRLLPPLWSWCPGDVSTQPVCPLSKRPCVQQEQAKTAGIVVCSQMHYLLLFTATEMECKNWHCCVQPDPLFTTTETGCKNWI